MGNILESDQLGRRAGTHRGDNTKLISLEKVPKEGEVGLGKGIFVQRGGENGGANLIM